MSLRTLFATTLAGLLLAASVLALIRPAATSGEQKQVIAHAL